MKFWLRPEWVDHLTLPTVTIHVWKSLFKSFLTIPYNLPLTYFWSISNFCHLWPPTDCSPRKGLGQILERNSEKHKSGGYTPSPGPNNHTRFVYGLKHTHYQLCGFGNVHQLSLCQRNIKFQSNRLHVCTINVCGYNPCMSLLCAVADINYGNTLSAKLAW